MKNFASCLYRWIVLITLRNATILGLTCSACRSVYPLRTRVSRGPTHGDEDHATHDECRKRPHVRIACRRCGSKITYHSAAFPRTVPSRRSSDERSRRFARRPRHDEMNDESLSADNDVARSLADANSPTGRAVDSIITSAIRNRIHPS